MTSEGKDERKLQKQVHDCGVRHSRRNCGDYSIYNIRRGAPTPDLHILYLINYCCHNAGRNIQKKENVKLQRAMMK